MPNSRDPKTDPLLIDVPVRLDTPRLLIRCPQPGDGAAYLEAILASLDALKPWMPWAHEPQEPAGSEARARKFQADYLARADLVMAMFLRGDDGSAGLLVGGTGLHRIDWSVPRFEIGYWCRSSHVGQGLVSEAVGALADMAFAQLRAQRVEIRCDDRNERSWRVAERCGFALEGVLRKDTRDVDGQPRDTRVYARVAPDA